jgi:gluconate 2-dehydrogenase subunit 3-like protein
LSERFSRRQFLAAAAVTGGAALLPTALRAAARAATSGSGAAKPVFYFLNPTEVATCSAICARVVPSTDPITGAPAPGAAEANAVVFIDRLLAAFSMPETVADNPAIYLRGPFSNRNAYPDYTRGTPKSVVPDGFLSGGQTHYVSLSDLQELSWRALIEGVDAALAAAPAWVTAKSPSSTHPRPSWPDQIKSGLIPGPLAAGLQHVYRSGLAAFNSYSQSVFGAPFSHASSTDQDLLLEAAGNVVLSQLPLPAPPGAPPDAKTLFPFVVSHTFEGCYGLPEYRGLDSNPLWAEIAWDGDTQPLGNSIYDENAYGPGEGPNAGFGEEGVFVPRGDYREFRPVSFLATSPGAPTLTTTDIAPLVEAWQKAGLLGRAAGAK